MLRELDTTELAHVQESQQVPIIQFDLDLNMALGARSRWIDVQAAGHPQMHNDHPC
jgi:hypothetical protein